MDKLLKAIRVIIENSVNIDDVFESESSEIFFMYESFIRWIYFNSNVWTYHLYYYPRSEKNLQGWDYRTSSIAHLAQYWDSLDSISFKSSDFSNDGDRELFKKLFDVLNLKIFWIDDVLDKIIASDLPF